MLGVCGHTGNKDDALKAYAETEKKIVGSGSRIDMMTAVIRLGLLHGDNELVKVWITKAKA